MKWTLKPRFISKKRRSAKAREFEGDVVLIVNSHPVHRVKFRFWGKSRDHAVNKLNNDLHFRITGVKELKK